MAATNSNGHIRPADAIGTVLVALVAGLVVWLVVVALPTSSNAEPNGTPYIVVLCLLAIALGLLWPKGLFHSLLVGASLMLPGLVLVWWTAPRGDEDGLWLLWFMVVPWAGALAGTFHFAAAAASTWLRRRQL